MKPPKSQFTLGELMGLVGLCAVGFALPITWLAYLVASMLIVVPGVIPGFVIERARGGTGIIGGTVSGCLIPMGLVSTWTVIEYAFGLLSISEILDLLPALYLLFVICLVWSGLTSSLLYAVRRRMQGPSRSNRRSTAATDAGIRFLPDDAEPVDVARVRNVGVGRVPTAGRGPDQ